MKAYCLLTLLMLAGCGPSEHRPLEAWKIIPLQPVSSGYDTLWPVWRINSITGEVDFCSHFETSDPHAAVPMGGDCRLIDLGANNTK